MFTIYSKEGREMHTTFDRGQAEKLLLEWEMAAFIIHQSKTTELILRQDCHPCVVSQIKDEPETKK